MRCSTRCFSLMVAVCAAGPALADELAIDTRLLADAASLLAAPQNDRAPAWSATPKKKDPSASSGGTSPSSSSSGEALSSGGSLGVGLQVGTPTALTLKLGMGGADLVLGIGAGLGARGFSGLSVHADYLFTIATLISGGSVNLTAYVGPGLWVALFTGGYGYGIGYYYTTSNAFGLGARFPLGVNGRFAAAPVEIYLEIDPALFVFPGIDVFLGASLGFRWFF